MSQLLALPIEGKGSTTAEQARDLYGRMSDLGDRFRDPDGRLWGTCRMAEGWARFPAILSIYWPPPTPAAFQPAKLGLAARQSAALG